MFVFVAAPFIVTAHRCQTSLKQRVPLKRYDVAEVTAGNTTDDDTVAEQSIDQSINQSINQSKYFIVRPKVDQRAGQLSLPHVGITKK